MILKMLSWLIFLSIVIFIWEAFAPGKLQATVRNAALTTWQWLQTKFNEAKGGS